MFGAAAAAITPGGRHGAGERRADECPGARSAGRRPRAPVPCTTLRTPGGRPASAAMSASSDAVSGAHSGGLGTTVLPAARAGPIRQVASISGAFHGRDDRRDAGRVVGDPLAVAADLAVGVGELLRVVGEEAEVHRRPAASRRAGATGAASRCRASRPGPGPRPAPRSRRRRGAGSRSARRRRGAAQAGKASCAAATAASTSAAPPRGDLARAAARRWGRRR